MAIEIGSSKIKGAVGQADSSGILTVRGIEEEHQHPNYVRYGCVQNVKEVANELNKVITKLNNCIYPERIDAVYVGIGGRSLRSFSSTLSYSLGEDSELTPEIVERVLGNAGLVSADNELLDVEATEFIVDGKSQGTNPVGVLGHEIKANVNIVGCRSQIRRNLELAVTDKLNLRINGYVVRPMALADLVLTSEERRMGTMMVDCGAETTTVAIYRGGVLNYLVTIPLGSRHITRDISARLQYLEERAEEVKRTAGNASTDASRGNIMGEMEIPLLNNIISARVGEIIANINEQLKYASLAESALPGGIVLVGGGAMLRGFAEELQKATSLPVRRGALPPTVRMLGSKITTGEDLDVISLLYRVALEPAEDRKPCTTAPAKPAEQQQPSSTNRKDNDDDEFSFAGGEDEEEEELFPPQKSKKSIWDTLFKKMKNSMKPMSDDEIDSYVDE